MRDMPEDSTERGLALLNARSREIESERIDDIGDTQAPRYARQFAEWKAAEALSMAANGLALGVTSGLNPLDIDAHIRRLRVLAAAERPAKNCLNRRARRRRRAVIGG